MNSKLKAGTISSLVITLCCITVMALLPQSSNAQSKSQGGSTKEVYTGTIVYIPGPTAGGPGRSRTTTRTFTLTITCTTPDQEVSRLVGILKAEGQDPLLRAISKEKCGVIQVGGSVGRDVNTVRVSGTEEGERKITMLFERWLEFFEVRYGTRSKDYPFTYIELFVNNKGKVEGTMIPAAKIQFKGDNTIDIENFAAYPARIVGERRNK
jgi:hypothetical protein